MVVRPASILLSLALWAAVLLLPGCSVDPCAGKSDQLASPEGLVITQNEHRAGWGSDSCLFCHPVETTHAVNCSADLGIDMDEVRAEASDGEYETCAGCHGTNGVE